MRRLVCTNNPSGRLTEVKRNLTKEKTTKHKLPVSLVQRGNKNATNTTLLVHEEKGAEQPGGDLF